MSINYGHGDASVSALSDVSFELADSEFVSVVGPSGCGKTTLLRVVAGFVAPTGGTIERPGGGRLGLVLQDHDLFPWMTVVENAAFALEMQGVGREERETSARYMLRRLGLGGREAAYPRQLSAGMRQRVAVARAFLSRPSLMLMDEPFGALDAITRQQLQFELLQEWGAHRPAVLFVTHDIEEAILLGSRVLVMQSRPGNIAAEFTVPFDYPRSSTIALDRRFLAMKLEILSLLGLAAQRQMAVSFR